MSMNPGSTYRFPTSTTGAWLNPGTVAAVLGHRHDPVVADPDPARSGLARVAVDHRGDELR